jgi:glutamyl-Q tRNA(Asp) synthetase
MIVMALFDLGGGMTQERAMVQPVFRFAPSPNGHLHLGHAYSAFLNARMAAEVGGRFLVRIEDTDRTRCTAQLASDALEDLGWLGLTWEEPVRYQSAHLADYDRAIHRLWDMNAVYPCFCSRRSAERLQRLDPDGQPHYAGACRSLPRTTAADQIRGGTSFGWRLDMARLSEVLHLAWGDMMIAKPGTGSSYHIAVVVDDGIQGVTHVVRGKDIEAATPVHQLLQRLLGIGSPSYFHHPLIDDEFGMKLSKSRASRSLGALRAEGVTPEDIRKRLGF